MLVPDTVALRDDQLELEGNPLLQPKAASATYALLAELISSNRPSRLGEGLVESALTFGPCLQVRYYYMALLLSGECHYIGLMLSFQSRL